MSDYESDDGVEINLETAIQSGDLEACRQIVENGDNDLMIIPSVYLAVQEGHYEIAKLLLERGADVNMPGGEIGTLR